MSARMAMAAGGGMAISGWDTVLGTWLMLNAGETGRILECPHIHSRRYRADADASSRPYCMP